MTSAQSRCIHSCRLLRNTVVWKSWVVISPVMPGASSREDVVAGEGYFLPVDVGGED